MVSQELVQAEQNIQREEQKFSQARSDIQKLNTRVKQTRQQLSRATPTSQQKVRLAESKREQEKLSQLDKLKKARVSFQSSVAPLRASIEDARAYETAKKHYDRGQLAFALGAGALQGRVKYWGRKILKQQGMVKQSLFKLAGGYEGYKASTKAGLSGDVALYQAGQSIKTFQPKEVSMEKYNQLLVEASKGSKEASYNLQRVTPSLSPKESSSPPQKVVSEYSEPTVEQKEEKRFTDVRFGKGSGFLGKVGAVAGSFFSKFAPKKPYVSPKIVPDLVLDKENMIAGGSDMYRKPTEKELFKLGGTPLVISQKVRGEQFKESIRVQNLIDVKAEEIRKAISSGGITEQEAKSANLFLKQYSSQLEKESLKKVKSNVISFTDEAQIKYEKFNTNLKGITSKLPEWKYDTEKGARATFEKYKDSPYFTDETLRRKIKAQAYTGSFLSGAYQGIKTKPDRIVKTGAIVGGITLLTGGLGAGVGVAGATALTAGRVAGYSLLGYYGLTVAGRIATTRGTEAKFFKAGEIASTEIAPMVLVGIGTRALVKRVIPPKKVKISSAFKERKLRVENVRKYGQYSRFAETGYKQTGFGKKLSPEMIKRASKIFGVSEGKIMKASLFRQTLRVKSQVGYGTTKSGKWGISFYEQTSKGIVEKGGTFRLFKGKATNWEFLTTRTKGNLAYTTRQIQTTKGLKTTKSYLTKSSQVFSKSFGEGVKSTGYKYTTRLIPKGYKDISYEKLWGKLGSTRTVGKGFSKVEKMPYYIKGVAKEGEFLIYSQGRGKPFLASKGIYTKVDTSRFIPKGKGSIKDYSAWEVKPTPKPTSTGSRGVSTKLITKTPPPTAFRVTPIINTVKISPVSKPSVKFAPVKTDTTSGVIFGLGVGVIGISKVAQESKEILKTQSKSKTISKTKQESIVRTDTAQIQPQLLSSSSTTAQKSISVQALTPFEITQTVTTTTTSPPSRITSGISSGIIGFGRGSSSIKKKKEEPFSLGYQVEVKRQGEYRMIGGVYTKSEAIKVGERRATSTLAATFRVTPTSKRIKKLDKERYTPNPTEFRSYKIVKGKKVELKDTWIQKRGKRLGRKSEVMEIKVSKKRKGRKIRII